MIYTEKGYAMTNLKNLIMETPSNKNASISIKIKKSPNLHQNLIELTSFLNPIDPPIIVRMRYIQLGIEEIRRCIICSSYIKSMNMFSVTCSKSCAALYTNRKTTGDQARKKSESISKSYWKKDLKTRKEIQEKRKKSIFEKYGVDHNFLIPEVRDKITKGNIEKYGDPIVTRNPEIIEKIKKTNSLKYGGNSPMCSNEVKIKSRMKCLDKFGIDGPPLGTYKKYEMPSGRIVKYLGFEDRAFNFLLTEMKENDFIPYVGNNSEFPIIEYVDNLDTKRRYFPDIFIPKLNKIIEVKSSWTYEINKEINDIKAETCKKLGYSFEFWIYNGKNDKKIIPKIIRL